MTYDSLLARVLELWDGALGLSPGDAAGEALAVTLTAGVRALSAGDASPPSDGCRRMQQLGNRLGVTHKHFAQSHSKPLYLPGVLRPQHLQHN